MAGRIFIFAVKEPIVWRATIDVSVFSNGSISIYFMPAPNNFSFSGYRVWLSTRSGSCIKSITYKLRLASLCPVSSLFTLFTFFFAFCVFAFLLFLWIRCHRILCPCIFLRIFSATFALFLLVSSHFSSCSSLCSSSQFFFFLHSSNSCTYLPLHCAVFIV